MSAPEIHSSAIDAALPDFDAVVACEFEKDCDQPAVWRVVAHGIRVGETECSVRTYVMCDDCLTVMRKITEDHLRQRGRPGICRSCAQFFRQVSDVIRSVVAL
ncbi:hypothetical protein SEA_SAHARA_51 [Gordonia phage Sahara]|nr:tail fiber protein [Gordonia phage Lamberg]YP_010653768.1 tail fiber protein [Gordonia phage Sahara]AZS12793.1 hypothetical protein SEA_SPROUTIE_52 [Gordonia phage Sproutie]QCW22534.1 hypothetical protein SEA_HALEY23_52 [Gordonia phage Haley23]QGJ96674.1 hypothetical protein SEA_CYNTHIA_52 [Gordonia phage Cynthia]QOC59175.1 hypothetical protein SEA_GEMG_52 [Gordonia phage GemG]QRI45385.1 hypothetical protein SEA_WHITECLAW_52 [Gordonia Phage Whiteclaw]QWT30255.1 hypothetical protein SEA_TU